MAKLVLDMAATQEGFFSDTAMVGIGSATPAYHFCWLLNRHFEIAFERDPDQNIPMVKKENQYNFPVYQYCFPNSGHKYLLYKLKNGNEPLVPEIRHLDYLWLIQTASPTEDAVYISGELKKIDGVQMAQVLGPEQLKNLNNLLV
jgi:hypothetical protein